MGVVMGATMGKRFPIPQMVRRQMTAGQRKGRESDDSDQARYPKLAELTRTATGEMSSRQSAVRGNVTHDVIARMWNGKRVSILNIARFCNGFKIDPLLVLEAAGYTLEDVEKEFPAYAVILKRPDVQARVAGTGEWLAFPHHPKSRPLQQVERVLEPDEIEILDAYEGLPEGVQASVREHILSLRRVVDEAYRKRTDIIGKLPHDKDEGQIERVSVDDEE